MRRLRCCREHICKALSGRDLADAPLIEIEVGSDPMLKIALRKASLDDRHLLRRQSFDSSHTAYSLALVKTFALESRTVYPLLTTTRALRSPEPRRRGCACILSTCCESGDALPGAPAKLSRLNPPSAMDEPVS